VRSERDPSDLSDDTDGRSGTATERRRRILERYWFAAAMLYALLRVILADQFLVQYGLNIYVFAIIEFVSTPLDAIGVARTVQALIDSKRASAMRWLMVALAGYVAPDAYVVVATRHVPRSLYLAVLAWIVIGITVGVRRLRRQVKKNRPPADRPPTD
jgi:hypothetical protein